MEIILEGLPRGLADPNVLVDFESNDDAGVYRISDDRALVFTVDIITPIVDDPRTFGRIAATNSISDIYAMGARPLASLNVSCFKPDLPAQIYRDLLAGAGEVALKAGAPVLGGHTVKDSEIKFGLAVVGEVHPDAVVTNGGARPGDALILTKPLGTAALTTALKRDAIGDDDPSYLAAVESMTMLNGRASEIAVEFGVNAMTDVTGFGLSGHASELARASGVSLRVDTSTLPSFPRAVELLREGHTCGGGKANEKRGTEFVTVDDAVEEGVRHLVHDPQTSGPLLISLPQDAAVDAVAALHESGYPHAANVGQVVPKRGPFVSFG